MLDTDAVFAAVRRGYNDLEDASASEIIEHFSAISDDCATGHINNIKGILFEQEYADQLIQSGLDAQLFADTNHPISDIAIFEDGDLANELQLKATDNVSYINTTMGEYPDIDIVTTTEIAEHFDSIESVIDSGITNEALEDQVTDTLFEEAAGEVIGDMVNPFSPLSVISWLVGLPF